MNKNVNRLVLLAVVGAIIVPVAAVSGINFSQAAPQKIASHDDDEDQNEQYHSHYRYSGNRAYAELQQVDEDTGIHTRVFIYASETSIRGSDNHEGSWLEIGIFQYTEEEVCQDFYGQEYCWITYVPILQFFGGSELQDSEFRASNSLRTAGLATQVTGYDYSTGEEMTVDVNAQWTGYGDIFRGRERYLDENNFYKYTETNTGASRDATVVINVTGDLTFVIEGGAEQEDDDEDEEYGEARIGKYMGGESEFERQR